MMNFSELVTFLIEKINRHQIWNFKKTTEQFVVKTNFYIKDSIFKAMMDS